MCIRRKILAEGWGSRLVRRILKDRRAFWIFGFSTCVSLFVEEKVGWLFSSRPQLTFAQKRRAELGKRFK